MIGNIVRTSPNAITFTIKGVVNISGVANALRRTLTNDITAWAAHRVEFHVNTSCQPDEYIAHRIGLVPLSCAEAAEFEVDVCGKDLTCSAVFGEQAPNDATIMQMNADQRVKCKVFVEAGHGRTHARFNVVAGAGYDIDGDSANFGFETINGSDPVGVLRQALEELILRVQRVAAIIRAESAAPNL